MSSARVPPARAKRKRKRPKRKKPVPVPWWRRVIAAVIAAGALAGAVSAIIALWPDPDAVDRVTITSAEVRPEALSRYVATATIEPLGNAEGADVVDPFAALRALQGTDAVPATTTASQPTQGTTGRTSSGQSTSSATSSSATTSATATTATSATETSGAGGTSSGSAAELAPPAILDVPVQVREQVNDAIVASPVLDAFLLPDEVPDIPGVIPFTLREAVDEEGEPLPVEEAARNLVTRLEQVRTTPSGGRQDPLGVTVTVALEMEGLRDEELLLYWRLLPVDDAGAVPELWAKATPAFRLSPSTSLDSASVDAWVPLPRAPGPYQLDLLVMHESHEAPLASQRSAAFD